MLAGRPGSAISAGGVIRGLALAAGVSTQVAAQHASGATVDSSTVGSHRVEARQVVWRDSATAFVYTRPPLFHAITDIPAALGASARRAFHVRSVGVAVTVVASTLVFIAADEPVLAESRRFARRVGLPPNHPSADVHVGAFKLAFPTTLGSGLYFLGDGLTSVGVAAGFAARGTIANDLRAHRVASEVLEALLASGAVTQVMKHAAGRQTPSEATTPRGRWRPFAPLGDYNRNVPAYDAFPSGHLASTMAMVTVVAKNYPEHRSIWPLGYATMGLLSFAMVNNGVHWTSDYPVALAIGGLVGNVVVDRGRTRLSTPIEAAPRSRIELGAFLGPGMVGVRARF